MGQEGTLSDAFLLLATGWRHCDADDGFLFDRDSLSFSQNTYMKDKFMIKIETWHKPDMGDQENVSHVSLKFSSTSSRT